MCATKALLAGDGDVVSNIFRERSVNRASAGLGWGWGVAYGKQGIRGGGAAAGKASSKEGQ